MRLIAILLFGSVTAAVAQGRDCAGAATPLVVPATYCVQLFADSAGPVRHLVVHPSGQLVAALNQAPGLVRMRDANHDGRMDQRVTFGPGQGGTGVTWRDGWLYFAADSGIIRYRWPATAPAPDAAGEWIARNLPVGEYGSAHTMKGIAVGGDGAVYFSVGSETDNCQIRDREKQSPGKFPCPELEHRAGIWRAVPPTKPGGPWTVSRYATGLRNAEALAIDPATGKVWAVTNGRDFLNHTWGWADSVAADEPAEMLELIAPNADYGWPYCQGNWTPNGTTLIRAPDYATAPVNCATKSAPALGFPGHWAPIGMTISAGPTAVAAAGIYVAFHGSRSRVPLPEQGHYLVFVPMQNGKPAPMRTLLRSTAPAGSLRPAGVAIAADGTIYVADDEHQQVWALRPRPPRR